MTIFNLNQLQFEYEPFPIGFQKDVVESSMYQRMVAAWPEQRQFRFMKELGLKYSLSEKNNPDKYQEFVTNDPVWSQVWKEIKSAAFIDRVISSLKTHHIDLGLSAPTLSGRSSGTGWLSSLSRLWNQYRAQELSARFEFSMMPSSGGCIKPHTDSPQKCITLVFSIAGEDEWSSEWGGGTDVMRVLNPSHSFNHLNRQAEFTDVEVLRTYEFCPNQIVVFVKTFNSWHGVRPMTGLDSKRMRKTLTINIEHS